MVLINFLYRKDSKIFSYFNLIVSIANMICQLHLSEMPKWLTLSLH